MRVDVLRKMIENMPDDVILVITSKNNEEIKDRPLGEFSISFNREVPKPESIVEKSKVVKGKSSIFKNMKI